MYPLAQDLLEWFDRCRRRHLPWREAPDLYRTWLSETMLQQTRVETVIPYFERFVARFPTVEALAGAPLDEVLALWAGLGYYARARNLHRAAGIIAAAGFPEDVEGWRSLPGVGPYLAGAIASIALGLDEPAVDGNVERVLARVFAVEGGRPQIEGRARSLLPRGRGGEFNQALMDLGSSVCTPRRPRCGSCPISGHCRGREAPERHPAPRARREAPWREAVCAVLLDGGRVLLARRPAGGLFGGLYELPGDFLAPGEGVEEGIARALRDRLGLGGAPTEDLGAVDHELTHMRIRLHVRARAADPSRVEPRAFYTAMCWSAPDGPPAVSALTRKALALALGATPPPPRRSAPPRARGAPLRRP